MNHREIQNGCGNTNNGEEGEDKTFLMKQVKLQQEAKIALAQVSMLGGQLQQEAKIVLAQVSMLGGQLQQEAKIALAQVSMLGGQKSAALLEGSIPNAAHV